MKIRLSLVPFALSFSALAHVDSFRFNQDPPKRVVEVRASTAKERTRIQVRRQYDSAHVAAHLECAGENSPPRFAALAWFPRMPIVLECISDHAVAGPKEPGNGLTISNAGLARREIDGDQIARGRSGRNARRARR